VTKRGGGGVKRAKLLVLLLGLVLIAGCPGPWPIDETFTFSVTADMRNFTGETQFRGALRALGAAGPGRFMVSPGDIDPPSAVYGAIQAIFGAEYDWYPVVGNHEVDVPADGDIEWLRAFNPGGTALPRIVNPGPAASVETCYSFDEENAHFVVINEYYHDAVDNDPIGDVSADLLAWLEADLAATTQPVVFVLGHEPAYPQPDMAPPHRLRHEGDSLDQFPANRDAFWQVLVDHGVTAYLCGHTHNYSVIKIDGVWQIDAGHARGLADTGAPSTFMKMTVYDTGDVSYQTWRQDITTGEYSLQDEGQL
jgi:hypothetical protein